VGPSSSGESADKPTLAGRCECGAVRYRVADAFLYAANCHCSRCRAATGSAFKPFAGVEREKLELEDGSGPLLVHGTDELNDTRCAACGSLLYSVVREGVYVHVALGSLVDDGDYPPTVQDQQEFVQLKGEADRQLAAWAALKAGAVASVERAR